MIGSIKNHEVNAGKPLKFIEASLFQWVNPKAWTIAITVSTAFYPSEENYIVAFLFLAFFASLVNLPCISLWALFGASLRKFIDNKTIKKIIEYKDLIIGFDIAGPELNYLPSMYKDSFLKVKNAGINVTIHAGEGDGVHSIQEALDNGAKRIGHGVRIIEDINDDNELGPTADHILQNYIPLEVCITSNLHTICIKILKSIQYQDCII